MELSTTVMMLYCVLLSVATEQELNLLVLDPIPDPPLPPSYHPSYAEGPALFLAAELAAEMVNRNSSILEGYHLNLLHEDSGCSVPFRAVDAFAKPLLKSIYGEVSPIVGVVGPPCSLSALSVAAVSGRSEIALINLPAAGTHRLQNRTRYPYSFSILDSSELIAKALVALTQSSNWNRVALFYDTSRQYFISVAQILTEEVNVSSNYLEPVGISRTKLSPIHSVKNKFRIVFLLVGVELISRIMCIAHHENYTYPAYQYVVHVEVLEDVDSVEFELGSRLYNCSRDQVRKMLTGSIYIAYQVERPDNESVTASGISLQDFKNLYADKVTSFNLRHGSESVQPSLFGALYYDAVWSLVLALDAANAAIDLGSYSFGQPNVTDLIAEKMVGSTFEGLSGKIQFNRMTGHVDQNAQFFLINDLKVTQISYYNKESNITPYSTSITENVYIKDVFHEVVVTVPKPLAYFTLILIFFGFILTLVLNVTTCAYSNVTSVKASGIKLSQVAFIGCYIHALSLLFAVLIYGFTDVISRSAVCRIQDLLDFSLSIGLTVLLGAICMRIWRLHRIFNRYRNPGKLLSDQYLILNIVCFVIIDLAFTVPAFIANKYEPTPEEQRRNSVVMTIMTCKRSSSTNFFLWFISSLVVSTVLLSIIFVLAIATRKIPQRNFKTNSIMYLSYTLTAVVPLILGVYFIFFSLSGYVNMIVRFCTLCSLLLCLIVIPCVMLFFPPLLPILKRQLQKRNHVHFAFFVSLHALFMQ